MCTLISPLFSRFTFSKNEIPPGAAVDHFGGFFIQSKVYPDVQLERKNETGAPTAGKATGTLIFRTVYRRMALTV